MSFQTVLVSFNYVWLPGTQGNTNNPSSCEIQRLERRWIQAPTGRQTNIGPTLSNRIPIQQSKSGDSSWGGSKVLEPPFPLWGEVGAELRQLWSHSFGDIWWQRTCYHAIWQSCAANRDLYEPGAMASRLSPPVEVLTFLHRRSWTLGLPYIANCL